jgi:maltooligosyltrehalose synthase
MHVCAYARMHGDQALIAIVPRLTMKLLAAAGGSSELPLGEAVWSDTAIELPRTLGGRTWRNVLTQEEHRAQPALPLATLLAVFPVALLVSA